MCVQRIEKSSGHWGGCMLCACADTGLPWRTAGMPGAKHGLSPACSGCMDISCPLIARPQLLCSQRHTIAPHAILLVTFPGVIVRQNMARQNIAHTLPHPNSPQARVAALRRQARLFSDRDAVRALAAGDVWVVVGWSPDLVPLAERTPSVDILAPASGTALWADVWVVPRGASGGHQMAGPSPILASWLEFCTMPARVSTLSGLR